MPASNSFKKLRRRILALLLLGAAGWLGLGYWQRQQPAYYWTRSQAASRNGDRDRAEFYLLQLIGLWPRDAAAHLALADLYAADARLPGRKQKASSESRAIDHLKTAAELQSDQPALQLKLMSAYLHAGRRQAAVQTARRAIALGSTAEEALNLVAVAALNSGDPQAAVEALESIPESQRGSRFLYIALQLRAYEVSPDRKKMNALLKSALERADGRTRRELATLPAAERSALETVLLAAVERARTLDETYDRVHAAWAVLEKLAAAEESEKQKLALAELAAQLMAIARKRQPVPLELDHARREERFALLLRFETLAEPAVESLKASLRVYGQAARAAFDRSDYLAAIHAARQGVKAHQNLSGREKSELLEVQAAAVRQLMLGGRFSEAQPQLTELLADKNTEVWAHFAAGVIADKAGRLEEAERELALAREGAADNVPVNATLMNVRYKLGRYDEVAPLLEELEARWSSLADDEANWIKRHLGGRDGIRLAHLHVDLALDRYDEALPHREALAGTSLEPRSIELFVRYHWNRKEKDDASRLLREGRGRFPADAGLILCEAEIDVQLSKNDRALESVRGGLVRIPGDRSLLQAEIALLCETRQWSAAHEAARRLAGKTPDFNTSLALSRLFVRAKWFAAARPWAEQSLRSAAKPQKTAVRLLLAEIGRHEGQRSGDRQRLAEARDQYLAILAEQPDNLAVANNLIWLWAVDLGQPKEALALIRQFRDRVGDERLPATVIDTFLMAYRKAGDFDDALKLAESTLERHPGSAPLHLHLGQIHAAARRPIQAREALETALTLGLSEPQAHEARGLLAEIEKELEKMNGL